MSLETVPANEQEHIDHLIEMLRAKMERDYGSNRTLRDAHPKMHGCVRGEFAVEANLPDELRIGLFGEAKRYPMWVRFSNQSNTVSPDIKGDIRGMALKLMGVPGEKLLTTDPGCTTHDFICISEDRFVTKDVAGFDGLVAGLTGGVLKLLWFFLTHPRAARNLIVSLRKFGNPLAIRYFSVAPYLLGTRAVKYSLIPHSEAVPAPGGHPPDNYLRAAMVAQLGARDAVFDFAVQFQTDPAAMPIEDPGVAWDEKLSPFHKVATVTIPAQTFDTAERNEFGDNLSFNPWRVLAEHRPLGGISRARLQVYQALSKFRHDRNHAPQVEPSAADSL